MIKRFNDEFILQCDFCSNYISDFDDFYDAVDYKQTHGWTSVRNDGEWKDQCPDCTEKRGDIQWV